MNIERYVQKCRNVNVELVPITTDPGSEHVVGLCDDEPGDPICPAHMPCSIDGCDNTFRVEGTETMHANYNNEEDLIGWTIGWDEGHDPRGLSYMVITNAVLAASAPSSVFIHRPLCESCREHHFKWCNNCQVWANPLRSSRCNDCGDLLVRRGESSPVRRCVACQVDCTSALCDGCSTRYKLCVSCKAKAIASALYRCSDCVHGRPIERHDFKPEWMTFGSGRLLGVELEYEFPNSLQNATHLGLQDWFNEFYVIMHDGTIERSHDALNGGFEIVSSPASLLHHQKCEQWSQLFQALHRLKFRINAQCGMHVHVSRDSVTAMTITKVLKLLYNEDNFNFFFSIAGRCSDEYGNFKRDFPGITYPADYSKLEAMYRRKYANLDRYSAEYQAVQKAWNKLALQSRDYRHYDALSLTPKRSVELRLFSAPSTFNELLAKLEFSDALFSYADVTSVTALSTDGLLSYIADAHYPALRRWLSEHNFNDSPYIEKETE